ncbi:MAG: N-acetyl sugar amidotransferase [Rubrivivax sp.]|nr:N-acetyl sugar amidotransferase [Rubrivivax sp.]
MKRCTKCLTKETVDTITFDEFGVCSVCRQVEFKKEKIDWAERGRQLQAIVERHKGRGLYDCIVPYSGGKDSTFQLWYIVRQLGLKPLVVRYNHWGYRPLVDENNTSVFKQLGVDVVEFTTSFQVVRELMLESLKRRGDFCWHCHTGIYAGVMHMAVRFDTPLIFWGESTAEYHSWYTFEEMEEVDEKRFNRVMNQGITADDMFEFLQGRVARRDLWMFDYPKRQDLIRLKVESICLGNYIEWNTKRQVEIIKRELGWKGQAVEGVPPEYDYEKIECTFQGMRDYAKYVKRGYGRTNHLASIDIRNGVLDRDSALQLEARYDGKRPASLDWFLRILQISEAEFYEILAKHQVHPWKFDPAAVQTGPPLPDMPRWDATPLEGPVGPPRDDQGRMKKYV